MASMSGRMAAEPKEEVTTEGTDHSWFFELRDLQLRRALRRSTQSDVRYHQSHEQLFHRQTARKPAFPVYVSPQPLSAFDTKLLGEDLFTFSSTPMAALPLWGGASQLSNRLGLLGQFFKMLVLMIRRSEIT